jgi:hypothetical protein
MTRWLWWMAATAGILASRATGARAECDPAQTKGDTPTAAAPCCKDTCKPLTLTDPQHLGEGNAPAASCCKDCCKQCCKDCCCKECCKECCTKGCCCQGGKAKTVTVTAPVVIFQLGGHPGAGTAASWLPPLPHLAGPIPPIPPGLPCPNACPGVGCPMACPGMPLPAYLPSPSPSEPRSYDILLKTVEACPGEKDRVVSCPEMMVAEGTQCSICFDDEAVLGKCVCATAQSSEGPVCGSGYGLLYPCHPGKSGGVLHVRVCGEQDGRVHLELSVQQTEIGKAGKGGVQTLCKCLHVVRPVKLGKTARVVLDRGADGAARRWLEVVVKGADAAAHCLPPPCSPEVLPVPKKEYADDGSFWSALGEFALEVLAQCCGCQTWTAGMTLPSGQYVQHPPQYIPPSPAFPLTRELASQEAVNAAPAACPAGPVMQCNHAWGCTTNVCPCAWSAPVRTSPTVRVAVVEDKSRPARLEVCCDGLCLTCKKFDLKIPNKEPLKLAVVDGQVALHGTDFRARANVVTTDQKNSLVLEGHAELRSSGARTAEIAADRIAINLGDGSLKINSVLEIKP